MKKVLGLVLELNPPHNGHQYFIDEAKRIVQPDITIGILSTNFTMRGDIACIDKFTRTKLALEMGLDMVLELPFLYAIQSADYFASFAIRTLLDFNMTDLAFGAELPDLNQLRKLKEVIQSDLYHSIMRQYLALGHSYSGSTYKAIQEILHDATLAEAFTLPNNTLAIQYLQALDASNRNVTVHVIKRIANQYYDEDATTSIASATAVRKKLRLHQEVNMFLPAFKTPFSFVDLNAAYTKLYDLLLYTLLVTPKTHLAAIHGMKEGIENRFLSISENATSYEEFVAQVQTKRYTVNTIQRLMLHILLQTPNDIPLDTTTYLRVLGFNKVGEQAIRKLPKEIKTEIFTSMKNRTDVISEMELRATKLFALIVNNKELIMEEYKLPIKKEKEPV